MAIGGKWNIKKENGADSNAKKMTILETRGKMRINKKRKSILNKKKRKKRDTKKNNQKKKSNNSKYEKIQYA